MAGLTRAQREAKRIQQEELAKAKPIVEKVPQPEEKPQEPTKIIGINQEIQNQIKDLRVKFNLEVVRKKYGCIPTTLYIGGSKLKITDEEMEVSAKLKKLLFTEGLI